MNDLLKSMDFFALVIASLSFFISMRVFLFNRGSIEIEIDKMIREANAGLREIGLMLVEHEENVRKEMEQKHGIPIPDERLFKFIDKNDNIYIWKKNMNEQIIEEYLNTYEEACSKYIDRKVDRKRFKNNYKLSIKQICESGKFEKELNPINSTYKSIMYVYKRWYPN